MVKQGVAQDVAQVPQRAVALQQLRGAYGDHLAAQQPLRLEARPVAVAEEDRQVEAFQLAVEALQVVHHLQFDFRVRLPIGLELGQQPAGGQGWLGADPQATRVARADPPGGGFQLIQQRTDFLHVAAAVVGQQQALANLLHQRPAECLLEVLDLPAHGALGQAELLRRAGHAHVPGEGGEAGQGDHAG
ncbi:hypothetical protein D9M68_781630 [compost metagenome]